MLIYDVCCFFGAKCNTKTRTLVLRKVVNRCTGSVKIRIVVDLPFTAPPRPTIAGSMEGVSPLVTSILICTLYVFKLVMVLNGCVIMIRESRLANAGGTAKADTPPGGQQGTLEVTLSKVCACFTFIIMYVLFDKRITYQS